MARQRYASWKLDGDRSIAPPIEFHDQLRSELESRSGTVYYSIDFVYF